MERVHSISMWCMNTVQQALADEHSMMMEKQQLGFYWDKTQISGLLAGKERVCLDRRPHSNHFDQRLTEDLQHTCQTLNPKWKLIQTKKS